MPQLDTSTWFITILSMLFTLFSVMQLKISSHHYYLKPEPLLILSSTTTTPWKNKWTKIYSPHSLPLPQ